MPLQDKLRYLVSFLSKHKSSKIIVYFLTCAFVDYVSRALPMLMEMQQQQNQQPSSKKKPKTSSFTDATPDSIMMSLHGKMAQKRREKTYESFVEAPTAVLLCTDVAGNAPARHHALIARPSVHSPAAAQLFLSRNRAAQPEASTSATSTGSSSSTLPKIPTFSCTGRC